MAKEWRPYLAFVVDGQRKTVTWSPQSTTQTKFNRTDPSEWSYDEANKEEFRDALEKAYDGEEIRGLIWHVCYGDGDQRSYRVSMDYVTPYIFVRLYRMAVDLGVTHGEMRVLRLLSRDLNDEEIGEKLGITKATVRKHLERLRHKFDVKTRSRLTLEAYRCGYINPRTRKHHTR